MYQYDVGVFFMGINRTVCYHKSVIQTDNNSIHDDTFEDSAIHDDLSAENVYITLGATFDKLTAYYTTHNRKMESNTGFTNRNHGIAQFTAFTVPNLF